MQLKTSRLVFVLVAMQMVRLHQCLMHRGPHLQQVLHCWRYQLHPQCQYLHPDFLWPYPCLYLLVVQQLMLMQKRRQLYYSRSRMVILRQHNLQAELKVVVEVLVAEDLVEELVPGVLVVLVGRIFAS